jgi:hypothetical protein
MLVVGVSVFWSFPTVEATTATDPAAVVDVALKSLMTGRHDNLVSLFRYFPDSVPSTDVLKDRRIVRSFFARFETHFGRPSRFESIRSIATTFVNVYMESATTDLWRNSDCLFREYAFATSFVDAHTSRRADVLLTVCFASNLHPAWLRRVDIHLVEPDPDTVGEIERFLRELGQEIQRARERT